MEKEKVIGEVEDGFFLYGMRSIGIDIERLIMVLKDLPRFF